MKCDFCPRSQCVFKWQIGGIPNNPRSYFGNGHFSDCLGQNIETVNHSRDRRLLFTLDVMRRSLGGTDCFTALLVSAAGLIAQATPPLEGRTTTECNGRLGLATRISKAGEA